MMNDLHPMTAQSPASGMPAYGQTSVARAAISAHDVQVSTCARIRLVGGMGLAAKGDFPGNRAWRPPSC